MLRTEFSRGFVSFCEKQMRMGSVVVMVERLYDRPLPVVLTREFNNQWWGMTPPVEKR